MIRTRFALFALALALGTCSVACRASNRAAPTTAASTVAAVETPEATVLAALEGREWRVDEPKVLALGPGAIPALLRIADDDRDDRIGYQRVRALLALRHQHTDEVLEFLLSFVASEHDAPRVRAALDSLAVGFGSSDRDRVLEACRALSSSPDPTIRDAAERASVRARLARAL